MKTIQSIEKVEVTVTKEELLENRWISFQILSKKLGEAEQKGGKPYKHYRSKLYNSKACNKYNTKSIAGILCVDTETPMKAKASLELSFKRV